ncbi:MAG TPA: F0F1 ATP synthase subunit delta [Jatrophihabitans sp.]|jgi:F-type H+-transporting ATPase subunit delta|uniref:F0F1 ATP synthase subunit delta n=1 Tax=Jatrophihabitans sp. TaxID=1932789 RepID=UPI002DFCEED8|nr:F0F1 ATP synthase subunit delta [Jatrophihabitans sp.]
MMRSASRQASAKLREEQHAALGDKASAAALTTLADELYAVAGLLVAQPRLRRTLGDPATAPAARTQFAESLFGSKIDKVTLQVLKAAVGLRWSSPWDLTDALERAGGDALFAAAEKDGNLDRVEDELFRFERILDADGEIATLLDEQTADVSRRTGLLESLVGAKVSPLTLTLLKHAVGSQRKRSIALAIDDLLEQAAVRQERSVARVISAVPLTAAQQERLAAALGQTYGRAISVRTALDPSIRGGLVIRVGDEVIDGSVATRIVGARTALAG